MYILTLKPRFVNTLYSTDIWLFFRKKLLIFGIFAFYLVTLFISRRNAAFLSFFAKITRRVFSKFEIYSKFRKTLDFFRKHVLYCI